MNREEKVNCLRMVCGFTMPRPRYPIIDGDGT